MTSVALLNRDKIISHLQQGGKLDDLHLGVSRQAISQALKDDPEYQEAQVEYHAARLDNAEQAILDASDNVDVARARALHQAYAWRAEREQRRIWGQQDQSHAPLQQAITINIGRVQTGVTVDQGGVVQSDASE